MSRPSSSSRHVNDLLHTLRGEQFRHSQNQRKSRTHLSSSSFPRHSPTLPLNIIGLEYTSESGDTSLVKPVVEASKKYSGPPPPKSWTSPSRTDITTTTSWRKQALSLIFREWNALSDSVLPLTLICLRMVLSHTTSTEFIDEIVPCLPPHLRLQLLRDTAIHSPLHNDILYSLLKDEGHIDGELIIVGPTASIKEDHFLRASDDASQTSHDWDSDVWSPNPLRTLVIMSTKLPSSFLSTLPPTITRLALINLHSPIPLHRLPGACPLLEILDLSYNRWLQTMSDETSKSLERLDWRRWNYLRILGIRECGMSQEIISRVNRAKLEDVEIIQ
ncbi:hypothetical protein Moror_7981 [Moniliophthora roreri MCA 2997]|uniref:Uncharacterized protein n=2 Tax=Moniliophthora roreri TaxID=221103 RepID=V2YS67_MONRO|nr:hypothetical protein Moror_7981 [Moniliophthora roreri MCA 2997]KAI3610582.1 hypothetical protein WG66_006923 [Moniliophthora roreri]